MKQKFNKTNNIFTQLIYVSVLGVSAVILSACGGGGGGSTVPAAATVDPANGEISVERDVVITATFIEAITDSDIDNTTFTLKDNGNNTVPGTASSLNDVATYDPANDLGVLRTYTAALSAAIEKSAGGPITAMSWSFTTRDGVWGAAAEIETDDANNATDSHVAFDPDGNAIAIWSQSGDNSVYSNYYTASTGMWMAGGALVENTVGGVAHLQIAMANDGTGVAIWSMNVGGTQHIYSNRYTPGVGWGMEEPIEANAGNAYNPQLAIDGSGNVIAVWEQPNNAADSIWVNRYDVIGGGWNTLNATELDGSDNAVDIGTSHPQIAIDDSGDAMVVWVQDDGAGNNSVYAKYYDALGDSWSSIQTLETADTTALAADIATDRDGNYIAVWIQPATGGGNDSVWANRYSGSTWGTAAEIEQTSFGAFDPLVAFDGRGSAMAVWRQNGRIRYNIYTANTNSWSTDDAVEAGASSAGFQDFAMDSEGHAIVVWRENSNGTPSVWSNRYQAGSGWGMPELLETDDTNSASNQRVAIDGQGNAIAVWIQNDGNVDTVWATRFE